MKGFTLIEILVVIAITAVAGIVAFVNLRGFGSEQNLKNNSLNLINILKSVQTNANASLKCNRNDPVSWQVRLYQQSGRINLDTACQYKDSQGNLQLSVVSSKKLDGSVLLEVIEGSETCRAADFSTDPLTISFTLLTGKPNFSAFNPCFTLSNEITITLKDSKDQNAKVSVKVNKGGAVYVK